MSLWKILSSESDQDTLDVQGYSVPSPGLPELLLLLDGKEISFVRTLLGPGYFRWKSDNKKRENVKQFIDEVFEAMGVEPKAGWSVIGILRDDDNLRALDADLIAMNYRIEDFFSEDLSFRSLSVIVEHLPDTSRLVKKLSGPAGEWTLDQHMLADLIDIVNYQTTILAITASAAGMQKPPKAPEPWYRRPQTPKKKKLEFTPTEDAQAFLSMLGG